MFPWGEIMDGSGKMGVDDSEVEVHPLVGRLVWVALRTGAPGADDEFTPQLRLVEDVIDGEARLKGGLTASIARGRWAGECFTDHGECALWCTGIMRHLSFVSYVRLWNWLGPNFESDDPYNK
mgnify:FL=1